MLKKIGAKNLITITFAVILIVAGVMNWRYNGGENAKILGQAAYVNNDVLVEEDSGFESLRLKKETAREEAVEMLKEIINNEKSGENQIASAQDKMALIAFHKEQEASCEAILKSKGLGEDVLVTVEDDSATVTVKTLELSPAQITQITETVMEQTSFPADKIKISTSR